jgi:formylglycine-generating enzyme required for sulfatase activity
VVARQTQQELQQGPLSTLNLEWHMRQVLNTSIGSHLDHAILVGGSISTDQANYDGNYTYGSAAKGENRLKTVAVDRFQPNPWGLYQVHGNVYEWVEDCDHYTYDGAPSDGSAWTSGECRYRVRRSGSWSYFPGALRAAARDKGTGNGLGIRLGRTLSP